MQIPKLVVFDVDGTLLDTQGACRPRTKAVLQALLHADVPTALATGRPLAVAEHTLDAVGHVDWVACGNGSSLLEVSTGRLHRDACLPHDVVEPLVTGLRAALPGVGFALEMTTGVVEEADFARRVPPSPHDPPVSDVLDALRLTGAGVRKVTPFHDDYDNDLAALAALTEHFIDDRCEVQFGKLPIVEVALAGDHKAVALQQLVDHLGVNVAEVVAFGDGGNDIEMLQWAGTGVAMGNASREVQAAADVTTAHVDDGGIAVFLEPLLTPYL